MRPVNVCLLHIIDNQTVTYIKMKKLLLLPLFALMFASCSTDGDDLLQEDTVAVTTVAENAYREAQTVTCLSTLGGYTTLDVSGGFGNPLVNFHADVVNGTGYARTSFTLSLEIQLISDCEGLESGYGAITRYSLYNVSLPSLNDPKITLSPSQLPDSCYRWRYVVEGTKKTTAGTVPCVTESPWYWEPIY